jgi:6-phosphogluconolactonase/glucosamine-6-phosphate isomerase/deaminase
MKAVSSRGMRQAISRPLLIHPYQESLYPIKTFVELKEKKLLTRLPGITKKRSEDSSDRKGGVDLIILGMGDDGHTASLFPGSKAREETVRVALLIYLGEPKKNRVSPTLAVLNSADQILFLVAGPSEAIVLYEILENEGKKIGLPAGWICLAHGMITWLIDQEAAAKLAPRSRAYRQAG